MTPNKESSTLVRAPGPTGRNAAAIRDAAFPQWRGAATAGGIGSRDEIERIHSGISALSAREFEVLRLVATGMTNYSIGLELGISERTAREHIARIMLKLRVGSRVEIAVVSTKWDFFTLAGRGQLREPGEAARGERTDRGA
ncbi:response regulator transcription factor [Kitasatospora viridis]|uniref:Regulatory LuxR family protein n=1 Tax=Kitasatospora viridis TaxID=281105 RepID=A0A561SG14_9ACTN|nr:LuxR family transcriptional regulator [Kitasatospora viridis]TWF73821.1 regulatory LuxR family protein [Kitasatospora viridis]